MGRGPPAGSAGRRRKHEDALRGVAGGCEADYKCAVPGPVDEEQRAGLAGLAETLVTAAKSAVVFHTGLLSALLHPADADRLLAASRFGDLVGWRCATLVLLAAVAFTT